MLDLTGKTMSAILSDMLLRITEAVNKREGSLIRTALSAASWAIEGIYVELMDIQRQSFGTTATGEYLDLKAAERGLTRIPATKAVASIVADVPDLPIGFQFADSSGYTWNVTTNALSGPDTQGLYTYDAECQTAGKISEPSGNLRSLSFFAGLTEAAFKTVLSLGTDVETDEELRTRYSESLVEIAFAGNIAAYRETILAETFAITGGNARVGALQVYPTTNALGVQESGHVKIWIIDSDYKEASQELIDAVQAFICPMYNGVAVADGYGFAPIGASVTIASATSSPVLRIDVTVTLSNMTIESVQDEIEANILEYVKKQKRAWSTQVSTRTQTAKIVIRDAFIYAAALVDGVADVTDVTLYKDGTATTNPSWDTNGATMEWIDDAETIINITAGV